MVLRKVVVMTGSTVVHDFTEANNSTTPGRGYARFNINSGPGAFSVSGSFTTGYVHYGASHTPNELTRGLESNGLFRIPSYHGVTDASALVSLANASSLAAGLYNGALFYMGAAGYSGGNAGALYHFSRPNCLYFCRNGVWHQGWSAPQAVVATEDPFAKQEMINYIEKFENAAGWDSTIAIANLSASSNFPAGGDTFESLSTPATDLSSFSNWASESDTTNGLTEPFTQGGGFFGTEAAASPTVTFEQGNGLTDGLTESFEQGTSFYGTEAATSPTVDFTQGSGLTDGLTEPFDSGFFGTEAVASPNVNFTQGSGLTDGLTEPFEDWDD